MTVYFFYILKFFNKGNKDWWVNRPRNWVKFIRLEEKYLEIIGYFLSKKSIYKIYNKYTLM